MGETNGRWAMGDRGASYPFHELSDPKFSLTDKKQWSKYTDNLNAARKLNVAQFARLWAEGIESQMSAGGKLGDAAKSTFDEVAQQTKIQDEDTAVAVNILNKVWTHGPELSKWFKSQE